MADPTQGRESDSIRSVIFRGFVSECFLAAFDLLDLIGRFSFALAGGFCDLDLLRTLFNRALS